MGGGKKGKKKKGGAAGGKVFRLTVVGRAEAGKSALCMRFISNATLRTYEALKPQLAAAVAPAAAAGDEPPKKKQRSKPPADAEVICID